MTKETSMATSSLVCSILCVIPLLGYFFGALSMTFGVVHLKRYYENSDEYGGEKRAIAGIVITLLWLVAWIWALVYYPETILG